jgi:hypothetical protein
LSTKKRQKRANKTGIAYPPEVPKTKNNGSKSTFVKVALGFVKSKNKKTVMRTPAYVPSSIPRAPALTKLRRMKGTRKTANLIFWFIEVRILQPMTILSTATIA